MPMLNEVISHEVPMRSLKIQKQNYFNYVLPNIVCVKEIHIKNTQKFGFKLDYRAELL